MNNFENDLFSGEDINNYFKSLEKDISKNQNNSKNDINEENDINIEDLNINEDEELKNFSESLNQKKSKNEPDQKIIENINYKSNVKDNSNLLNNYITRLKNFGFPDIGEIILSDNPKEQEKTFKFFDYIILKKANNLDDYQKYKRNNDSLIKRCEELEIMISKYKKEVNNLRKELKLNSKEKNDFEFKSNKLKEYYDKQISQIKKENIFIIYFRQTFR